MFKLVLLATFTLTSSLETCRSLRLSEAGDADGTYTAPTDYRGRPDFFREDGAYNLFGEENGDLCYWRIDSTVSEFPYWISYDCAYHPLDIEAEWFTNLDGLNPEISSVQMQCGDEPGRHQNWEIYLVGSAVGAVGLVILVWGHILCRRNRLRNAKRECVVCKKTATDAARVIERAFDRKPSIL